MFGDGAVTVWSISADTGGLEVSAASLNGSSSQVLIMDGGGVTDPPAPSPSAPISALTFLSTRVAWVSA